MLNFSRIPAQSLPGQALRGLLRLVPKPEVVPILQGPLRGQRWIVDAATQGCWLGTYELSKQEAFQKLVRPGSVVFDIGANVGLYTLLASRLVGPQGKVVAFEPLPRNVPYLRRHLELNDARNVELVEAAVSNYDGAGHFRTNGDPHLGQLSGDGQVDVRVTTLDEFMKTATLQPELLKIDVEGAEADVLAGAVETLRLCRPTIVLATHNRTVHQLCCSRLESLGYRLESLTELPLPDTDELLATI
jgi:FkbM family methyltransferase